jgi:ACS family hexuronate transporter-like MFS transporter
MGGIAAMMPLVIFVPYASVPVAMGLFTVAYLGHQAWSTLVMILPADLFPKRAVGAVAGLVGFGGALGGVVFGQVAGYLLDHQWGYGPVFLLAGTFHVIAFLTICYFVPTIQQLNLNRTKIISS